MQRIPRSVRTRLTEGVGREGWVNSGNFDLQNLLQFSAASHSAETQICALRN